MVMTVDNPDRAAAQGLGTEILVLGGLVGHPEFRFLNG
jgi:hypothetical protein